MTTRTTRNALGKSEANDLYNTTRTDNNANFDLIDSAIALCNWNAGALDPDDTNDETQGYSIGSEWHTETAIWKCTSALEGAAVWEQIWPALVADMTGLVKSDGSVALSANWDAGAHEIRAEAFESDVATGTAPLTIASETKVDNLNADMVGGIHIPLTADADFGNYQIKALKFESDQATGTAPFVVASTTKVDNLNVSALEGHAASYFVTSGSPEIWRTFPGTPTRVSDSQFTIADAGGANSYAAKLPKGTVIKWEKSGGGFQCAMIKASTYGADVVTIDILGNDLVAGFTLMKYCILPAEMDVFIVPGKLPAAATADIGKTIYWPDDRLVFSTIIRYKTAATTTKGVWDINDDGTSIFSTKPEIAATATVGSDQISNCILDTALTVVAAGSLVTLDYDSGHATTPGSDAYVILYSMPYSWRYRA